jgi:hypothetical protein
MARRHHAYLQKLEERLESHVAVYGSATEPPVNYCPPVSSEEFEELVQWFEAHQSRLHVVQWVELRILGETVYQTPGVDEIARRLANLDEPSEHGLPQLAYTIREFQKYWGYHLRDHPHEVTVR